MLKCVWKGDRTVKNTVGKAVYDELSEWADYIFNLNNSDTLTLILNKNLLLYVERNEGYVFKIYSKYVIDEWKGEVIIDRKNLLVNNVYSTEESPALLNYLSFLFQEYVRKDLSAKEAISGLFGVVGTLGIMSAMTCVMACV